MAQSKGLVLITGVNGYIAQTTAKAFLDAGYSVRGTARSRASSLKLLGEVYKQYLDAGNLEIVEVKDITMPGAFDEAVKGEILPEPLATLRPSDASVPVHKEYGQFRPSIGQWLTGLCRCRCNLPLSGASISQLHGP